MFNAPIKIPKKIIGAPSSVLESPSKTKFNLKA